MKFLPIFRLLSTYPFLSFSSKLFQDLEIEKELSKFPDTIENAKRNILQAVSGKVVQRSPLETFPCFECELKCSKCGELGRFQNCNLCMECFANCTVPYSREAAEKVRLSAKSSVLTFAIEKMLVSKLEDWVRMRFAVNEAESFSRAIEKERDEVIWLIARDLGLKLRNWEMHISSYLKASSRIRDDEWRLLNKTFSQGYVKTTKPQVLRIIKEYLRMVFFEKIDIFFSILEPHLREIEKIVLKERRVDMDLGAVDVSCFPPCMAEILSEIRRGMNVPHTARFALTSFLLNIGMKVDEIIEIFKTAPDFDEEKSRYQIEHIAGMKGKGTEYTAPSCNTMRTYQNCVSSCNVKHPLIFYKNCKKRKLSLENTFRS